MKSVLPYAYAAMCAFLLLSTVCGDDSSQDGGRIAEFTRAIERNPNDANAYNDRGIAFSELGEYRRAIED